MDVHTPEKRSYNMSRIEGKNTKPEIMVRKWLWSKGYRYKLYNKVLPGKPDIVFPGRKKVIFIHGC
jgi:DNA mismatch endonuclease (patch repair protein)